MKANFTVFLLYTHKGDQTKIISLSKLWKFKIQKSTDFKDSNLTTGSSLPKKKKRKEKELTKTSEISAGRIQEGKAKNYLK